MSCMLNGIESKRRGTLAVRLAAVLLLPGLFSPAQEPVPGEAEAGGNSARRPGEVRWHSVAIPNGEILPGDRLVWYTGEFRDRNEGVVCAEDEDGLFLEEFGVRVKDTVFIEMPRGDEDWSAVQALREERNEFADREGSIESLSFRFDAPSPNRTRVLGFLRELADRERPGLYVSPYLDNGLRLEESRADLLKRIARGEREARGFIQFDLLFWRERILRHAFACSRNSVPGGDGPAPIPADFAAEARLNRFDCSVAWHDPALGGILVSGRDFSHWTLVPRRLPAAEPVPVLPPDAAARLDALAAAALASEEAGGSKVAWPCNEPSAALSDFAVEAAWQVEVLLAGSDAAARDERLPAIARLLAATLPAEMLPQFARRAAGAFPREPQAWRFAADLCAELLAARPAASSGSTDWPSPSPRTEDELLDLAARRAVVPIRSCFRSSAFRDLLRSLPPGAADAFRTDIYARLGLPPPSEEPFPSMEGTEENGVSPRQD